MDNQLITAITLTDTLTMTATLILQQRIVSVMQPTAIHTHRVMIITTILTPTPHIRPQLMMLVTVSTQEIISMDIISEMIQTLLKMCNILRLPLLK